MNVKHVDYRKVFSMSVVLLICLIFFAESVSSEVVRRVSLVVCPILRSLISIATGIAALVMVLAGIKWTASENDPGARKGAKDAMIHALVGLIIITIVDQVIDLVASGKGGLPRLC